MTELAGQRILLGVSGGIAAYKAAELVRRLKDDGAEVRVVMTRNAARFVAPLTFQALSGQAVRVGLWDESAEAAMGHIELARWADRIVIAPASADLIARLAHGMANDLLSTLVLASRAPLSLAPAMNQAMWAHPALLENIARLTARGVEILGPGFGSQACGDVGAGRMLEAGEIVAALRPLAAGGVMSGLRMVITAGPTYEDIDPVRFIGNRSSGQMGFAVAAAAREQGAQVTLVAGPVRVATPRGVARVDVRSAADMHAAVMEHLPGCDIFVGAAAVADYRPRAVLDQKLKKASNELALDLVRTPDILAEVAARADRPFVVGFAAETHDVLRYARDKLQHKRLDMICANQVGVEGQGFDAQRNQLNVLWDGGERHLPCADKGNLARDLVQLIAERRTARIPLASAGSAS